MIRNIIFDWSGTLVDDLDAVWRATNGVLRKAGVAELTVERFRSEFCLPYISFYSRHVSHIPSTQLEDWFRGCFEEAQDSIKELPHARTFLSFCRARGLQTFVLSAVFQEHYQSQSARTGFHEFIDHAYVQVRDKRLTIGEIIREHGLQREETLFIGDMQHDIETARQGAISSCAVLTGYNGRDQLQASDPDLIVENLEELRTILERHELSLPRDPGAGNAGGGRPIATVGGLIFNSAGEVLMIRTRKWSNLWGIPGGKIEFGESSSAALQRELKEETNLDVTDIRFVLVQDCIHSKEFHRDAHFVLLNYTCCCSGVPQVVLNDEAQEFRWIGLTAAQTLPLNQPTRVLIQEVLKRGRGDG
ncbi:MAG TPA: NUDIX domain-containing protein [Candidatus Nitrosotalea sp.]|nr:NUDIX domain-containing protein [Candidatus Nitrosotalea sp.]